MFSRYHPNSRNYHFGLSICVTCNNGPGYTDLCSDPLLRQLRREYDPEPSVESSQPMTLFLCPKHFKTFCAIFVFNLTEYKPFLHFQSSGFTKPGAGGISHLTEADLPVFPLRWCRSLCRCQWLLRDYKSLPGWHPRVLSPYP